MGKLLPFILLSLVYAFNSSAQQANCNLKSPQVTIHFGAGNVSEQNAMVSSRYGRVASYCPTDGHYTFTPNTSDCFRGDWFDLAEDHTPGDANGNMLLVNSSPRNGTFFTTSINGLKAGTEYEFGVWLMNVCRITEKCPFPLLPDITIRLQTASGTNVAQLETGEVQRHHSPRWTQYRFMFTTPPTETSFNLIMINNAPGGCGNDFAMDDVTFRECVITPAIVAAPKKASTPKKTAATTKPVVKKVVAPVAKKTESKSTISKAPVVKPSTNKSTVSKPPAAKPSTSKSTAVKPPVARSSTGKASSVKPQVSKPSTNKSSTTNTAPTPLARKEQNLSTDKVRTDSVKITVPQVKQRRLVLPPPPPALRTRTNALVRKIETEAGEIRIDLYDNGEIDDDTVSIYHNNSLLAARARLSQKAITFRLKVDDNQPHHELVMVAENLGSIPPNTSLMIVTAGDSRHEVFISSTKQKNAKVVLDLKE